VDGKTGLSDPELTISEILLDFRIRRWRCGSFVRQLMDERDVRRLSSSVRSMIVEVGVCGVRLV
jgi:hypothetical protein